ncbi:MULTISPECIES: cysteine peptidase family C39 domain-containing protein [Streptomyces]|uniref:cysteine peptidase family C39 domain-containing protein n=1 Tax=Streptomyces TaxID=1883 RepID=UPI00068BE21E|nr:MULTISPECIES: cysteine peptidase family C39 domain-containing protein [Streptomyces]
MSPHRLRVPGTPLLGEPLAVRRFGQHFTPEEIADPSAVWPTDGPHEWGERCCGLACLRMLLDFHGLAVPDRLPLLHHGLALGAHTPKGWLHAGLVRLASEYGLQGHASAFPTPAPLQELARAGTPSIVSCSFRFPEDGRQGGHLVLFTGEFERDGEVYAGFADPSRWGADHAAVPAARFWSSWTGRAIVLTPVRASNA